MNINFPKRRTKQKRLYATKSFYIEIIDKPV